MNVTYQSFGQHNGVEFTEIFVENQEGVVISFCDMGARINQWLVPTETGTKENVVLGHKNATEVVASQSYYGATVGRVAGRIANGRFELNGHTYELPRKDCGNHLHGGFDAMDVQKWDYQVIEQEDLVRVVFTYVDKASTNGYPGTLNIKVTHTFNDYNEWTVHYEATTDEDTLFNPTNHVYFNLNGNNQRDVTNHLVQVNAQYYLPVNDTTLPIGDKAKVEGTPFDLRTFTELSTVLSDDHEQITLARGFDHPFVLTKWDTVDAMIECPENGRLLTMITEAPTVVIYTHNYVTYDLDVWGHKIVKHSGITLETQVAPDAINQTGFGNIVLRKGDVYNSRTTYSLSI